MCRKKAGVSCDSLRDLVDEARVWAKARDQKLPIKREPCLSGCVQGLTVLVETSEGSIRCQRVQTKVQLRAILDHAEAKIHAPLVTPVDGFVLSRTNWAEWEVG